MIPRGSASARVAGYPVANFRAVLTRGAGSVPSMTATGLVSVLGVANVAIQGSVTNNRTFALKATVGTAGQILPLPGIAALPFGSFAGGVTAALTQGGFTITPTLSGGVVDALNLGAA